MESREESPQSRPERPSKGKRKRADGGAQQGASDGGDSASSDAMTVSGPNKAGQSRKGNARKPKGRKPVNQTIECLIEWPDFFKSLEKTHRALNLVFTFCCTRKHLATTFDTIKAAVETHTKRPLIVEDVSCIVALRPEGINFGYVDEVMLQTDIKGSERDDAFRTGSSSGIRSQAIVPDISVGGMTGLEGLDQAGHTERHISGREVLYFEFIDGDLKRQVQDRLTGEPVRPSRKLREEDLKVPVYSQKQMTLLIERRNQRFTNSVIIFINRCVAEGQDPEQTLKKESVAFIPAPSVSEDSQTKSDLSTLPESIPKERKSIPDIVQELKDSPWYTGQIVPDGHRVFEAQEAVYGDLDFLLSQDLVNAIYNAKGITQFFAHQAEALNSLHHGQNVVVATSTSSGKSLIYQLPVLYALEKDHSTRAMYIFPTKALAQDQKRSLKEMMRYMPGLEDTIVETFDGDTPMSERNLIREEARIIFTNPDMLHITILPQEERWRNFLKNLKFVVGKTRLAQVPSYAKSS
jgi:DEAD/DEAH box helicase domain-containing protein